MILNCNLPPSRDEEVLGSSSDLLKMTGCLSLVRPKNCYDLAKVSAAAGLQSADLKQKASPRRLFWFRLMDQGIPMRRGNSDNDDRIDEFGSYTGPVMIAIIVVIGAVVFILFNSTSPRTGVTAAAFFLLVVGGIVALLRKLT